MEAIKFIAWVPELEIVLENVTLYGEEDGECNTLGISDDAFSKAIPEPYHLDHDSNAVMHIDGDKDIYDEIMSVLVGEDWIWLESGQFEAFQAIDRQDIHGKDIFEDFSIVKFRLKHPEVDIELIGIFTFDNEELRYEIDIFSIEHPKYACLAFSSLNMSEFEVIGNKFQNPELIKL